MKSEDDKPADATPPAQLSQQDQTAQKTSSEKKDNV